MDIIISLGGSLIVPDDINIPFLKKFHSLIINYIKGNNRVAIITGGGKTARLYMEAAEKIAKISQHDQDWIGIHTTRLNAQLMRDIFKDHARPEIVKDPTKKFEWKHPILIGAGWKPGCSTDYDAVLLAKNLGIKNIINLTNVDQVYDKDPSKHKDELL